MTGRTWLQMGEAVIGALDEIEKLTHIGGPKADAALVAIRAVLHSLEQGFQGKATAQEVLAHVESMRRALDSAEAVALGELHERFKKP